MAMGTKDIMALLFQVQLERRAARFLVGDIGTGKGRGIQALQQAEVIILLMRLMHLTRPQLPVALHLMVDDTAGTGDEVWSETTDSLFATYRRVNRE